MRTPAFAVALFGLVTVGVAILLGVTAAPGPADGMDLQRYLGRWYVIARAPANGDVGAYFEFRQRGDGRIDHVYYGRDAFDRPADAVVRVAQPDPAHPSRWVVRSNWLWSTDRVVLYVSPDYRLALAGDPDQDAAWILAREPEIAEWSYAGLLARLSLLGYDVTRLVRVPQKPEQVGMPGFED